MHQQGADLKLEEIQAKNEEQEAAGMDIVGNEAWVLQRNPSRKNDKGPEQYSERGKNTG